MTGSGRPRGIVIEFLGMPGVGKTALAGKMTQILCERECDSVFVPMDSPSELGRYAKVGRHLGEISRSRVMWRMLQTQARRLRAANRWRS
jgi:hypothetical protein